MAATKRELFTTVEKVETQDRQAESPGSPRKGAEALFHMWYPDAIFMEVLEEADTTRVLYQRTGTSCIPHTPSGKETL